MVQGALGKKSLAYNKNADVVIDGGMNSTPAHDKSKYANNDPNMPRTNVTASTMTNYKTKHQKSSF